MGYALSHGSRKKRRVGNHVKVPSGNLLEFLPPPITSPLSDCVERCVQLLGLRVKHPVNIVEDIPNFVDGFVKRSTWDWPGLDCPKTFQKRESPLVCRLAISIYGRRVSAYR